MHMKFISFIAGTAIILAGCAGQARYTGTGASAGDAVPFMTAPDVVRY